LAPLIAALMLRSGYGLLRDSGRIVLEGVPPDLSVHEIGGAIARQAGMREVRDPHVWEINSGFPALAAHLLVGEQEDCHAARRRIEHILRDRFEIEHTTLQLDHQPGQLLQLDLALSEYAR
jgi:cobalt-zinc-cadmium efflux system protein